MDKERIAIKSLCLSIWEEAKAIADYIERWESCWDDSWQRLFQHIADEEAKHLAMFISKLASMYPALSDSLMKYQISEDPLENEKD